MAEMFSEIGQNGSWKRPDKMLLIKSTKRNYPSFYNTQTHKWGGLLNATIFENDDVPEIPDSEIVDYRKETSREK